MTTDELQNTVVKISIKTLTVLVIGIVSIVSSFWIGYTGIISGQNDIKDMVTLNAKNQEIKDLKQDNEIAKIKDK